MTINQALLWAQKKLAARSDSPQLDVEVLLMHTLSSSSPSQEKAWIFTHQNNNLTNKQFNNFKLLIAKRRKHVPVAYLTGHKEFYGLDFKVTPDVLIPRPETEMLVELALAKLATSLKTPSFSSSPLVPACPVGRGEERWGEYPGEGGLMAGRGRINIIDIGAGSGCIIISIAKKLAEYDGSVHHTPAFYGLDISEKALKVARQNARRHKVLSKIKFLKGDLLNPLPYSIFNIPNSIIIANLPYLTTRQLAEPSIKHEPKQALHAGPDGLKYFRELFEQISTFHIQHSTFLLEHDPSQKTKLKALAKSYFPNGKVKSHKDLTGKNRVLEISSTKEATSQRRSL